jgi:hypothetical protein
MSVLTGVQREDTKLADINTPSYLGRSPSDSIDSRDLVLLMNEGHSTIKRLVELDDGGRVILGEFEGRLDFFSESISSHHGGRDIFVAKANPDGEWIWVAHAGSQFYDYSHDLLVGEYGNIWISGTLAQGRNTLTNNTAMFGDEQIVMYGNSFVAKLNQDGEWLWTRSFGSSNDRGATLSLDDNGGILISGTFCLYRNQTCHGNFPAINRIAFLDEYDLDEQMLDTLNYFGLDIADEAAFLLSHRIPNQGRGDLFIGSLDSLGFFDWVKGVASPGLDWMPEIIDLPNNEFMIGGSVCGWSQDLCPLSMIGVDGSPPQLIAMIPRHQGPGSVGQVWLMYARLFINASSLTEPVGISWVQIGGSRGADWIGDIVPLSDGDAIISGYTCESDYDGQDYCEYEFAGQQGNFSGRGADESGFIFVARIDDEGYMEWIEFGSPGSSHPRSGSPPASMAVSENGAIIVTGIFDDYIRIDDFNLTSASQDSERDIYVATLDTQGNVLWIVEIESGLVDIPYYVTSIADGFALTGFVCGRFYGYEEDCWGTFGDQQYNSKNSSTGFVWVWQDSDHDGRGDASDNCPEDANHDQADYDWDRIGDVCDVDDDNDGIPDADDECPLGLRLWRSDPAVDHDEDGCRDFEEDDDDDGDGIPDEDDACPKGSANTASTQWNDHDGDGCLDISEDSDDDNDSLNDTDDRCPRGEVGWLPDEFNDKDGDGCRDATEDTDDDNDGVEDEFDDCDDTDGWISTSRDDPDGDGCRSEFDIDDDGDGVLDIDDACPDTAGSSLFDFRGCPDSDRDGWSDVGDRFPYDETQWNDSDGDGYGDRQLTGTIHDACPTTFGNSTEDRYGCPDADGDGWSDMEDAFPNDATRHLLSATVKESEGLSPLLINVSGFILFACAVLVARRSMNNRD